MSLFLAALLCFAPADPPLPHIAEIEQKVWSLNKQPATQVAFIESLPAAYQERFRDVCAEALRTSGQWVKLLTLTDTQLADPKLKPEVKVIYYVRRIQALRKLNRLPEAVDAHFPPADLNRPDFLTEALNLARTSNDWVLLEQTADKVLSRQPAHADAMAWKAESMVLQGKMAESEPFLIKAVALKPKQVTLWANLAACRQMRGASAEALEAADRAIALDALCMEAHRNRAAALMGLNRYEEAQAALTQALVVAQDPAQRADLEDLKARTERYLVWQQKLAAQKAAAPTKSKSAPRKR